jgi:hypothetical protein
MFNRYLQGRFYHKEKKNAKCSTPIGLGFVKKIIRAIIIVSIVRPGKPACPY